MRPRRGLPDAVAREARRVGRVVVWLLTAGVAASAGAAAARAPDVVVALEDSASIAQGRPAHAAPASLRSFVLALPPDARLALVVFGEDARLPQPFTAGADVASALDGLAFADAGSNPAVGLERAIYELKRNGRPGASAAIVLVTDGGVDTGDRTLDRVLSRWMVEALADEAAAAGIRVYGLGLTEAADFRLLQTVTQKTGGAYFRASTPPETLAALDAIRATLAAPGSESPASAPATKAEAQARAPDTDAPATPGGAREGVPQRSAAGASADVGEQRRAPEPAGSPAPGAAAGEPGTGAGTAPVEPAPAEPPAATPPAAGAPPPTGAERAPAWLPAWWPERGRIIPWLGERLDVLVIAGGFAVVIVIAVLVSVQRRGRRPRTPPPTTPARRPPAAVPTPGPGGPLLRLVARGEATGQPGHEFRGGRVCVGRVADSRDTPGSALVVEADTVSRRHAVIEYRDGRYVVQDCGSVNGTYVNDERIDGERHLAHGDRLRFGSHEFEVVVTAAPRGDDTVVVPAATGTVAMAAGGRTPPGPAPAPNRDGFDDEDETLARPQGRRLGSAGADSRRGRRSDRD